MKFADLTTEYNIFSAEIERRWFNIKKEGRYLFGAEIKELELSLPKIIGKKYGVAVKHGTDALFLTLKHIYQKGMPIILPNFGAYPTAFACRQITDNLIYVDVDASMTIDITKLPNIQNGIIVPVHLFGNNCQMKEIMEYAKINNHIVIEDCAQSTGSGSGQYGDYSIFSFYPTKPLSSMGDGGMICSNNNLEYFKKARVYGIHDDILGLNSRMDEFQAAVVNCKINSFMKYNNRRIEIATRFKKIVNGIKINSNSIYHQFTLQVKNRKQIINKLKSIPYMIHYEKHSSEIPVLKGKNKSTISYRISDKIISLPIHQHLKNSEVEQIEEFLYANRKEEIKYI